MENINAVIGYLRGTTNSLEQAIEIFGLDIEEEDLGEAVEDTLEMCSSCGWWCEIHELWAIEDNEEDGICDDCR